MMTVEEAADRRRDLFGRLVMVQWALRPRRLSSRKVLDVRRKVRDDVRVQ